MKWQGRSHPPRARGASASCRPVARTPPCKMIKEHAIIIQRVLGLRFSAASARSSAASPRSSMSRNTCAPCKIFEGYVLSSKGPSSSLLYLLSSHSPTDPAGTRRKRRGPQRLSRSLFLEPQPGYAPQNLTGFFPSSMLQAEKKHP